MTRKKEKYIESDYERLHDLKLNHDDEYINHNLEIRNKCNYVTKTVTAGPIREVEIYPVYKKMKYLMNGNLKRVKKLKGI